MLVSWKERPIPSRVRRGRAPARDVRALEQDPPLGRPVLPAQEVEEGGLPGAVGPDDGLERERRHVEADVVHRDVAAEAYGQVAGGDDRVRRPSLCPLEEGPERRVFTRGFCPSSTV